MVDSPGSSADGSGQGKGGGKRGPSSPPRPPSSASPNKRSKADSTEKGKAEADKPEEKAPVAAKAEATTSSRPPEAVAKMLASSTVRNALPTAAAWEAAAAAARGWQARQPPHQGPWARLLSQSSETPHLTIRHRPCTISFGSVDLCKFRLLEESGQCRLEVTGEPGWVRVNRTNFIKGTTTLLADGDEIVFSHHYNNAYIFQYLLNGNEVPISVSAGENNQGVSQTFKDGLKRGILCPDDIQVTLENFPYYLSENTKSKLLTTASIHMEHKGGSFIKSLSGISCLNQRILLSSRSGTEIYQETIVKALAKKFGARLLIVDSLLLPALKGVNISRRDANTFGEGSRVKYIGQITKPPFHTFMHRGPSNGCRGRVMLAFENNVSSFRKVRIRFDKSIPGGNDLGDLCDKDHGFFYPVNELSASSSSDKQVGIDELNQVISEESKSSTLIVFVKDLETTLTISPESNASLGKELPPGVLIIASYIQIDKSPPKGLSFPALGNDVQALISSLLGSSGSKLQERNIDSTYSIKHLNKLFPNRIYIEPPKDKAQLSYLNQQIRLDAESLTAKANVLSIRKVSCNEESLQKVTGFFLWEPGSTYVAGV